MICANRILHSVFAAFVLLIGVACAQTGDGVFRSEQYKVSFKEPAEYQKIGDSSKGVFNYLKREAVTYSPRFNLTCTPIPARFPGNSIPPDVEKIMRKSFESEPEFEYIGSARLKVAGSDALSIGFRLRDENTGVIVRVRSIGVAHQQILYNFIFSAPAETFASNSPTFEAVIKSVRWQEQ